MSITIIEETTMDVGRDDRNNRLVQLTVTLAQDSNSEYKHEPGLEYLTYVSYDGGKTPMFEQINMTQAQGKASYKRRIRQKS